MPTLNGTAEPKTGEMTGRQRAYGGVFSSVGGLLAWDKPWAGTYETYRRMRADPTLAMVRAAACAPVKGAAWAVEADDDAPSDAADMVQDLIDDHRPVLLTEGLRALDYGWQPLEVVWNASQGAMVVERFKPLLPDMTDIIVGQAHGDTLGVRQGDVTLSPMKSLVFAYDAEAGNPYGRSRNENVRENAWTPWRGIFRQMEHYYGKAAGVIPIIRYPVGTSAGENGATVSNDDNARQVLSTLGSGAGVAFPWQLLSWMEDAIARGIDPKSLMAWQIDFLETSAGHGAEFTDSLRYFDALKVRGWLVPERAVIEGQFGTKAEAGVHADLGIQIAQETGDGLVGQINRQVVDTLLAANFGPNARGKVRIVQAKLTGDEKEFLRGLVTAVYTNPANVDLFLTAFDVDAILDQVGIPKATETVDQAAVPVVDPTQVANQIATQPGPAQQAVADQSLNGAQIASMVTLVMTIADRQLPPETVRLMMKAAFPGVGDSVIDQIVSSAAKQPKPAPVVKPGTNPLTAAMSHVYRSGRMR
ncbi:MAG: hypothetical protein WC718_16925 [Phycisphaerales bacterium]|jgi:hypothetical protein